MDSEGSSSGLPGSDNQDSNEPAPPGTVSWSSKKNVSTPLQRIPKLLPSSKGVENAKKRLRAFSIQKKSPITPAPLVKPASTGNTTVLIGKLSSVKVTPKVEDDPKKPPKPPKPGSTRKNIQDSYTDLQKRTLSEIEDMKRKMELVDLGIPLGLICPSSNNDKAMPTKAMPPIKSFLGRPPPPRPAPRRTRLFKARLDASKVDEIIREAKKARAEGREFKFDYQKVLPDYDNPFQRKKDDPTTQEKDKEENIEKEDKYDRHFTAKVDRDRDRAKEKSKRKSDRYDGFRRHSDFRKDDRDRYKEKRSERAREREKSSRTSYKSGKSADKTVDLESKETDVNLNDYLVCDSWSLDNDDKTSSPHVDDKSTIASTPVRKDSESKEVEPRDILKTRDEKESYLNAVASPKVTKLQPVIDSFKFEIDPNDDEILDVFDEDSKLEEYGKSKSKINFDYNQDTNTSDSFADDNFLESVINEIKQEDLSDDDSQDKGLVEYDSPLTDYSRGQGTPELDDSMRLNSSQRSDYAESYRSTDSGCKSTESGYRSTESAYKSTDSGYMSTESVYKSTESDYRSTDSVYKSEDSYKEVESYEVVEGNRKEYQCSVERELDDASERNMTKETADSLDMWNFVLKICQPLLFRHDRSKCYKETRTTPSVWWAERVAGCNCVRGRSVVTGELRAQRMALVDRVYGCDQIADEPAARARGWYPARAACLAAARAAPRDRLLLDEEYQRFMQAVWPEAAEATAPSQSNTPERSETEDKAKKGRKIKISSEGWSQESDIEEDLDKSKKQKGVEKEREKARKRKRSSSTLSSTTDDDDAKRKRTKKKAKKKLKSNFLKRVRTEKKQLKKLKAKEEKQKKKKKQTKVEKISEDEQLEEPKKKVKEKKIKKKQLKAKKTQKKKKAKAKSPSSSSSSSSSSSDSDDRRRKAKKKKKKHQGDTFDLNILNNIKTEKLTDDENCQKMVDEEFSPRRQQARRQEIINVKELQNDFVGVQIKQEVEEMDASQPAVKMDDFDLSNNDEVTRESQETESHEESPVEKVEFKEPQDLNRLTPQIRPPADETNLSQCSSQESICSETEQTSTQQDQYEKDDSHLRPSSQNSNYSFNDVIASQSGLYPKGLEPSADCDKFDGYEQENYEMYEQLAMAYQSDVASNQVPLPSAAGTQRIETVALRRRGVGEIKCDWRAGDAPAPHRRAPQRSRWGLKPNEVNIVLTGGSSEHFTNAVDEPVYQIESIANRNDNSTGYDEAYMDTYGALDRLQYGDCFARPPLAARIHRALHHTALGDMATEPENQDPEADKENMDKGILVTRMGGARGVKRVSFADGYKPGQDSDTEEPPLKKKRRPRRFGCAWPCPATHPDHAPLWDALPPPPPPPGSPPRPRRPDARPPLAGFVPPAPPPQSLPLEYILST